MLNMIYPLIDSHCHLEKFAVEGILEEVLQRAHIAGVEQFITVGTCPQDWQLYQQLAKKYPKRIFYTVGVHPCQVQNTGLETLAQLETFFCADTPAVAMGEIGLDYFHLPKDPQLAANIKAKQKQAFEIQLQTAKKLNVPIVIHSRGAFDESVAALDASGVDWTKVIFHCFVEDARCLRIIAERGGWASFTGILTYKNAQAVRAAAIEGGVKRFILETDCPYLTPEPKRGLPNEPAFLAYTAQYAAELFGLGVDVLRAHVYEATCQAYGLSASLGAAERLCGEKRSSPN